MTADERAAFDKLTREYIDEVSATPDPKREQWEALLTKWQGKVNTESLLQRGLLEGWIR